ncbi:hypothetical protein [Opitutus terrae]|uniref:hypothetical protein n=1 Tax=Opitutus terrae TaxID=107709 RepID=UPI0011D0C603|nr:hypothetical protein [Opitutus terrae]
MPPGSHTTPKAGAPHWRVFLLLCSWFIATGAHWDVVQVAAWGRMWIENARTQSSTAALARTFSPEGMCEVCHVVQAAKHAERENSAVPPTLTEKAPLLLLDASVVVITAPTVLCWLDAAPTRAESRTVRPPVPPPRRGIKLA